VWFIDCWEGLDKFYLYNAYTILYEKEHVCDDITGVACKYLLYN